MVVVAALAVVAIVAIQLAVKKIKNEVRVQQSAITVIRLVRPHPFGPYTPYTFPYARYMTIDPSFPNKFPCPTEMRNQRGSVMSAYTVLLGRSHVLESLA